MKLTLRAAYTRLSRVLRDSVDQDQTVRNVKSDLGSTLLRNAEVCAILISISR